MNTHAVPIRLVSLVLSLFVPLAGVLAEEAASKPAGPTMVVTLTDGSRIVCTLGIDRIPVKTSYSSFEIPLTKLEKLERNAAGNTGTLLLVNGDRLQGQILLQKIPVRTAFGDFEVPLSVLQQIETHARPHPKTDRAADDRQARAKCMNNLRLIDHAKEVLAIKNNLVNGSLVAPDQISPYIDGGIKSLRCPAGGKYKINPVDKAPECSIHGTLEGN